MKSPSPRVFALVVALASIAQSAVAEDKSARADSMTVSVTVDPTCTVGVTPGAANPAAAIDLLCRNFRKGQPQPIVFETDPRDGHDVVWVRF